MIDADKTEMVRILRGLAAVKPGKELTAEAFEIWWLAMKDRWSIEGFKAAASHLARESEFMPSPFHFEQLRKAGRPTSGEAFWRAVKHAGSSAYRIHPSCGDPRIDAAVRGSGGYIVLAMCDEEKLPFLERRFNEHYEAIQDSEDVRGALPELVGPPRLPRNEATSIKGILSEWPDEWTPRPDHDN